MQCNFLHLALTIAADPPAATRAIKAALRAAGASIVSAERLDDRALVIAFEAVAGQLEQLLEELQRCARIVGDGEAEVRRLMYELRPELEVHGSIHATLVHAAP